VDEDDERALPRAQEADAVAVELDVLELGLEARGGCGSNAHWIRIPEIAREMTRRWISEVPSKIV
jgi:hypothetical protein